jgi:hypothetical protein
MRSSLHSAGVSIQIESDLDWVDDLIAEGAAGQLQPCESSADASLLLRIEPERRQFTTRGWEIVTRGGVWRHGSEVVFEDVCTTGFDIHLQITGGKATFTYRWLPPAKSRVIGLALRSRFHLLARAALVQYPALWWAGTSDRAPLHASRIEAVDCTPLVSAAGGVGRSTFLLHEVEPGSRSTGDNLGVSDGHRLWGLVEPVRVVQGEVGACRMGAARCP